MLDVITYRYSGHSPSDASSYRGRQEIDLWRAQDSIRGFGDYLRENGHADAAALERIEESVIETISTAVGAAVDLDRSPRLAVAGDAIGALMFSNEKADALDEREPDVLQPLAETRLQITAAKHRFGLDEAGRAPSPAQDADLCRSHL